MVDSVEAVHYVEYTCGKAVKRNVLVAPRGFVQIHGRNTFIPEAYFIPDNGGHGIGVLHKWRSVASCLIFQDFYGNGPGLLNHLLFHTFRYSCKAHISSR